MGEGGDAVYQQCTGWAFAAAFLLQIFAFVVTSAEKVDSQTPVTRISFGSCANQSAPQPIWDAILKFDPNVFIWLGDNIYADSQHPRKIAGKERNMGPWKNAPRFYQVSPEEMQQKYNIMKNVSGYVELRKLTEVIGTWDDHDYGLNDAGKELNNKTSSQKLMLDFLDEPLDSPRRKQEGVYASYSYGPVGKRIKVILLDTRYHRDPLHSDGTMLGIKQWAWFEKELRNSDAQIHIIGSSIQVVSNFSAMSQPFFNVESWNLFPLERLKLYGLLRNTNVSGVIFISGDVHFGEISRYDCGLSYPVYDITSSGITQGVEELAAAPFSYILPLAAWIMPNSMRVFNSRCRYRSCIFGRQNFGSFEIDWDAKPVAIKTEVRDVKGDPVVGASLTLAELQPGLLRTHRGGDTLRHCTLEVDLPWYQRYLLAILFFSTTTVCLGIFMAGIVWSVAAFLKRRQAQKPKPD